MKIIDGKEYIVQVKDLILEYMKMLDRDLTFQNIEEEIKDPAKKYTLPEGELLVAVDQVGGKEKVIGMVAYRRHSDTRCEMKRLYVTPDFRGERLGEKLISAILEHAKKAGYKEMVLDTIVPFQSAIHLYKKFKFKECEPYYYNPMDDAIYMKKEL